MKAVILAGGLGTRISEETAVRPKPMIDIGGKPILWHILKIYSHHGINDFIICLGYKGYMIKEYFANYFLHMSDVTIDLRDNSLDVHQKHAEPWRITLVDTGEHADWRTTQARRELSRQRHILLHLWRRLGRRRYCPDHRLSSQRNRLATVCAVQPPGRFGALDIEGDRITAF